MYDLSIITDALQTIISTALNSSPVFGGVPPSYSVKVTGQHPQSPPSGSDCDLNLYLFHVVEDKYLKNSFWTQGNITGQPPGPALQPIAYQPLCLDLYYILTAQSQGSYVQEQQVMSVAMRALHEYGIVHLATPNPAGYPTSEVSLTLESPTWSELSVMWQALNVPLRMAAQYKASVAMLMPETGQTSHIPPTVWTFSAQPATWTAGDQTDPSLLGTTRRYYFTTPLSGKNYYYQSPASAAPAPTSDPNQAFMLHGAYLADVDKVYLIEYNPDGTHTETDISTTWKQPLAPPYTTVPAGGVPFLLRPPAPPAPCPPPGRYGLCVGQSGDPTWRSAVVPFELTPWIDPTGGPLLSASGGVYTITTANVPATGANLFLGTVPLTQITSGTPAAGQWLLSGSTVTFVAPAGLPKGDHMIRIRAGDTEADPSQWVAIT